ncbi:MAG: aminoacyl-tRNA hydrolase [Candidatus Taylorbacteria bacterium]|nr:aminoacyl-tRNA hydrolase [Candidatus Taylorbacteria bacterium]
MYIVVGLGNPGNEYKDTRHNTGRMVLETFRIAEKLPAWQLSAKIKALSSSGKLGREAVTLVEPETFMNQSGISVAPLIKSKKAVEHLVVIHDDLDIPLGKFKISFNKSSGGHRGVASIIKALKTQAFLRLRVGISPATPSGKLKKPRGDAAVDKHILGEFSPVELAALKKLSPKIAEALKSLVVDGREKAMSRQYI